MKVKNVITLTIFGIILISCQSSDCSNGQQDGNETGVDCGGDCAPCNGAGGQDICSTTPNLYQKLYCVQPDTAGLWSETDGPNGEPFSFTVTDTTSQNGVYYNTLCGNSSNNQWNDTYYKFTIYYWIDGMPASIGHSYLRYDADCKFYAPYQNNIQCDPFTSNPFNPGMINSKFYVVDHGSYIHIITQLQSAVGGGTDGDQGQDTLTYYLIN